MFLPYLGHFFNWDILSLRQEEEYKDGHDHNPEGEEEEETKLQVAKHCQENLSYEEGENHVH